METCLKNLRATKTWLLIIRQANLITPPSKMEPLIDENEALIAIFAKSVKTAKQKGKEAS
jgi:hypothetical protein